MRVRSSHSASDLNHHQRPVYLRRKNSCREAPTRFFSWITKRSCGLLFLEFESWRMSRLSEYNLHISPIIFSASLCSEKNATIKHQTSEHNSRSRPMEPPQSFEHLCSRTFSPVVLVRSTPHVEQICRKNQFSFIDMLRPYQAMNKEST